MASGDRFTRQIALFGKDGQDKIRSCRVAVVGVGGIGTHVVQQLSLLGVGRLVLIDKEELEESNRNRYVGARYDDPVPGAPKVDIGQRIAAATDPAIVVEKVQKTLVSDEAFGAIRTVDCVLGCVDKEGVRLILTELCAAYGKPYVDVASDVIPGARAEYGGSVCVSWAAPGCLVCFDELDLSEARDDIAGPAREAERRAIYGVASDALGRTGPSVVSINGVVASLAVTEFMVGITGIRPPKGLLKYRGSVGKVTVPAPDSELPRANCYYCVGLRGKGEEANVERYIREGVGAYL